MRIFKRAGMAAEPCRLTTHTAPDLRRRRRSLLLAAAVTAVLGTLAGTASPASAAGPLLSAGGGDIGKRWTVCAQDLNVRSTPGGPAIGVLTGPQTGPAQTFTITGLTPGGEWVHGHAWGHTNRDGYIQNGWFCTDNQVPAPVPVPVPAPLPAPPPPAPEPPAPAPAEEPPIASAASADPGCGAPFYAAARPKKDRVFPVFVQGSRLPRAYTLSIASYLRRCGGYVHARHCVYIDTRALPRGTKVWFGISTQRSDGKWARAHTALQLDVSATQEIQEKCVWQRRGVIVAGRQLAVTQVKVVHTAPDPSQGIPLGSTLHGAYKPYYGQEATPAS